MFRFALNIFATLAVFGVMGAANGGAKAAGAIAIGRCDRYGYSFGAPSPRAAARRAIGNCARNGDSTCEVVVSVRNACGAFAISRCEARGWAYAGSRGAAERIALGECEKRGGSECHVRAWVCDAGP